MTTKTILPGIYTSQETAYMVKDYPYGFVLRCEMRNWIEYKKNHGFRHVSQTTNPKRGNIWNKPKASTYSRFGMVFYLDEKDYLHSSGLHEYMDSKEVQDWMNEYSSGLTPEGKEIANKWLEAKILYQKKIDGGVHWVVAGGQAISEVFRN